MKHKPKSPAKHGTLHLLRPWGLEIGSLFYATGLLATIIIILATHHGQKIPDWPYSINLNTLIALLSTLFRAAIVSVLAEIISQSKWTWFEDAPRPLKDLQVFDDASRSVLGSLNLIGLLKFGLWGSPLAMGAALMTVFSLSIGSFTQQALKTIPCSKPWPDANATIPIAHSLSVYQVNDTKTGLGPDVGARAALIAGLINPNGNDSKIQASCPTGNCTFPEIAQISHSTLGLCSKCIQSLNFVQIDGWGDKRNMTLGATWLSSGEISRIRPSNLSYALSSMDTSFREIYNHSISSFSVLALSGDRETVRPTSEWSIMAASCVLYPCMKNIAARVQSGHLKEKIISTVPALDSDLERNHPSIVKSPCVVDGRVYDVGNFSLVPNMTSKRAFTEMKVKRKKVRVPTDCYYYMHSYYVTALRQFLDDNLLFGECGLESCGDKWWLSPLFQNATFERVESSFDDVATAATNYFRKDGLGPKNASEDAQSKHILGEVYETTACIQLDASWLIMPVTLYLITGVLFGTSLLLNRFDQCQPAWKSNILPLLFYGLDSSILLNDEETGGFIAQNLGKLQQKAAHMIVRFQLGDHSKRASFARVYTEQPPKYEIQSENNSLLEVHKNTPTHQSGVFNGLSRSSSTPRLGVDKEAIG